MGFRKVPEPITNLNANIVSIDRSFFTDLNGRIIRTDDYRSPKKNPSSGIGLI